MIIVYNPAAGRRRAQLLWRVLDVMVANGMRLELAETGRPGHATTLARDAASRGKQLVVAAGGDGTIAEVANGLMGSAARMGVIPLGTANVLAHELSLPFDPRAVAAALAFGRTRPLWPGVARGPAHRRVFVQMLGIGFDAHVVGHMSQPLKRLIGRTAYVLQTARELSRYRFRPVRLVLDGTEVEAASAIVSKGALYGGRFLLAPGAQSGRPDFSVTLFERSGPVPAALYGLALPLDMLSRAPGVRQLRASRVELPGVGAGPVQCDGDCAESGPLVIENAEAPIQVVTG